ncbi:MAG: hypothetical protein Q9180_009871, partial [Flavoplaca navasiana]
IKRNAATSPLLTLPSELRDKIWTEVLGGRLVHLNLEVIVDEYSDYTDSLAKAEYYWQHNVCQHDGPEDQPDRKRKPHFGCRLRLEDAYGLVDDDAHNLCDDSMMHLTVLRASRQIYVEANRILWTTNTFSFANGTSFGEFMKIRKSHQKQLIRNLRFDMRWGWGDEFRWNSALGMALIKSLSGLQTLRLHIVCNLKKECWDHNKDRFVRLSTYTDGLRKLSILPLRSTEIAIQTSGRKHGKLFGLQHRKELEDLWQKGDREK